MSTTSGSGVRTFTLAPLFAFIISIFSPPRQEEQKKPKSEQQYDKVLLDEAQQCQSRTSKTGKRDPTSIESVRTFTLDLHKYINIISGPHANIDCDRIETLWRMKNALSDHDDVLNELTALHFGEPDVEKRRSLSESIERGVQTNAVIVKFIWDCCHDGHPRGLLKYRVETAFFTDQVAKATDEQQSVIYAYKIANGDALLS